MSQPSNHVKGNAPAARKTEWLRILCVYNRKRKLSLTKSWNEVIGPLKGLNFNQPTETGFFRVTTELSECLTSGGFASEGSAVVRVQGLTPKSLHHNAALHHTRPRFSEPLHLKSRTSRAQRSGCTFWPPGRWQDRPKFCRSSPSTADSNTPLISECSAGRLPMRKSQ